MCAKLFITKSAFDGNGRIYEIALWELRGFGAVHQLGTMPCRQKDEARGLADKMVKEFAESTLYEGDIVCVPTYNGDLMYMFTTTNENEWGTARTLEKENATDVLAEYAKQRTVVDDAIHTCLNCPHRECFKYEAIATEAEKLGEIKSRIK